MEPTNRNISYSITQASDMAGLSKQVIRKWEDRYGIVSPERLSNGYRVYSQAEIGTLIRMKNLIEQGFSASQAAEFIKRGGNNPIAAKQAAEPQPLMTAYLQALLAEGSEGAELEMNHLLQQAYHSASLPEFLDGLIVPFLREVGQRWQDGRWGEYQEALSSLVVRDFLIQLRRNFQVIDRAPVMLGACLPHERHEIPLHILALKFMLQGWKTVILGPSPAPSAIQSAVRQILPQKVVLSAVTMRAFDENSRILEELDEFAAGHPHIDFYLGGPGAVAFAEGKQLKAIRITENSEAVL
ncbi:MerR family transcriptional regulator [Indiicoccus explosivorum]|uniref:MerR family transcriptional regulator n=1 Tax=Indiicoccus explosivorum TaxID=1917864 RepID=UPI000B43DC7F|nr:MerR family transcriptional regulator [Indiicoccus explosivorum]